MCALGEEAKCLYYQANLCLSLDYHMTNFKIIYKFFSIKISIYPSIGYRLGGSLKMPPRRRHIFALQLDFVILSNFSLTALFL